MFNITLLIVGVKNVIPILWFENNLNDGNLTLQEGWAERGGGKWESLG
jgi:hypothetical protein